MNVKMAFLLCFAIFFHSFYDFFFIFSYFVFTILHHKKAKRVK